MPNRDDVRAARRHFTTYAQYEYFFNRINDPRWIEPLLEEGYLKNPPAVRNLNGFLGFPGWPESRFLARIAHRVPELVADVFRRLPENSNVRVAEDIVDAALDMPPEVAATLVPLVTSYLGAPFLGILPMKIARLIQRLSRDNGELALSLAEVLLDPQPDDRDFNDLRLHRVRAPFEDSTYKSVVDMLVPTLVDTNGLLALEIFSRLLSKALCLSRIRGTARYHDLSQNWRPNIDAASSAYRSDVRNCLVNAVRDSATQLIEAGVPAGEVIHKLKSFKWCLFRRIAIFLLLPIAEREPYRVQRELVSRRNFDDPCVRNEYNALLALGFPLLDDTAKTRYIAYSLAGPNMQRYRRSIKSLYGRVASTKEAASYRKLSIYERLKPIAQFLPPSTLKKYTSLADQFADHSEGPHAAGWIQASSPKSAKEINELAIDELVALLKEPVSNEDRKGQTVGLVRELSSAVRENPRRYVEHATMFACVSDTYLSAILNALRQKQLSQSADDWASMLKLIRAWCDNSKTASEDSSLYFLVREILETLKDAVKSDSTSSAAHRDLLKHIIRSLQHIVYGAQDEREHERDMSDIEKLLPINNVETSYYELCVHYGLWVYRQNTNAEELVPSVGRAQDISEPFEVLANALEVRASKPLYFSLGQHFPYLLHLDTDWTRGLIVDVFPSNTNHSENAVTSWNAYVTLNLPNILTFETLRDAYRAMIESLGNNPGKLLDEVFDERLAVHLTYAYAWGIVSHEKASLIDIFYRRGSLGLRRYFLRYIGTEVGRTDSIPPDVINRFQALWDDRVASLEKSTEAEWLELAGFSHWFATRNFPIDWSLPRLLDVLRRTKTIDDPDDIMLRLDEAAEQFPAEVLSALSMLLQHQQSDIDMVAYSEHLKSILEQTLSSPDSVIEKKARAVIDRLMALGYAQYRELV